MFSDVHKQRPTARRPCRENKHARWQQYVPSFKRRKTLKPTWDMVHGISGKYNAGTVYINSTTKVQTVQTIIRFLVFVHTVHFLIGIIVLHKNSEKKSITYIILYTIFTACLLQIQCLRIEVVQLI